jgi:NAD(P)-dependent dehydrogenase (short-subunit alcohol dehydrogenase family)
MLQTFSAVPRPAPQTAPLNILVTGAARGIGFELVKQYSDAHEQNVIVAAVRDIKAAAPLKEFAVRHPNVHIVPLDTGNEESINASVTLLPAGFTHLDLLWNNAGVMNTPTPVAEWSGAAINELLRINVTGPMLVIKAYRPLLLKAASPKILNVSSELGAGHLASSVAEWGVVPYGASKAALNFINLALKAALPEVTSLAISPGWVGTDMGSSFGTKAPVSVEDSASALRAMAQSKGKEESGGFFDVVLGNKVAH